MEQEMWAVQEEEEETLSGLDPEEWGMKMDRTNNLRYANYSVLLAEDNHGWQNQKMADVWKGSKGTRKDP